MTCCHVESRQIERSNLQENLCEKSNDFGVDLFGSLEECKGNLHVVITGSAVAPTPSLISQSIMGVVLLWAGFRVGGATSE